MRDRLRGKAGWHGSNRGIFRRSLRTTAHLLILATVVIMWAGERKRRGRVDKVVMWVLSVTTAWPPQALQSSSKTQLPHPRSHLLVPDIRLSNRGFLLARASRYHRERLSPTSHSPLPSPIPKGRVKRRMEHTLTYTSPSPKRPTCLPHCTSASLFSRDPSVYHPDKQELGQFPKGVAIFSHLFRVMSLFHLHRRTKTRRPQTQNWNLQH